MAKEKEGERGFQMVGEPHDPDSDAASKASARASPEALAPITFGAFVLSLSASAAIHLGLVPGPEGGEPSPPNLTLAKQTIDILEMLQEKTQGNLDDQEKQLLDGALHELRLAFVQMVNAAAQTEAAPEKPEG